MIVIKKDTDYKIELKGVSGWYDYALVKIKSCDLILDLIRPIIGGKCKYILIPYGLISDLITDNYTFNIYKQNSNTNIDPELAIFVESFKVLIRCKNDCGEIIIEENITNHDGLDITTHDGIDIIWN